MFYRISGAPLLARMRHIMLGGLALATMAGGAQAITVNSANVTGAQNAFGTAGTSCSHGEVSFSYSVNTTTVDVADGANPNQHDRFVIRLVDANGNIIASNGYSYAHPDYQTTPFASGSVIRVGNSAGSTDTVVAPTLRPFRLQIFESTTSANTSVFAATGGALYTSAPFDPFANPATTPGYTASGCATVPGGYTSDATAPVVTVPANISVNTDAGQASAVVTYAAPTANDDVDGAITPTRTAGLASGAAFPAGTTTVTYSATDNAGNTGTASFTVTVSDNENPVVTAPANISVNTDAGQATAVVNYSLPTATDNVAVTSGPTLTAGLAPGAAFPVGTTTVTYSASDATGNTGSDSFTVTVTDAEGPAITVPANIAVNTDPGLNTALVSFTVSATDAVDGSVAHTITTAPTAGLSSGDAFPLGITTVTVSATDTAGNNSSDSFTVTVADGTAPIVSVPANIVTSTDPGLNTAVITFTTSASDAVDGPITPVITTAPTAGLSSGDAFPVGTTTVTATATDNAGNTGSNSFTVTISDGEAPVFTSTQPNISVQVPFTDSSAIVSFPTPTASDNTPGVTVTQISGPASGSAFPLGTTTVSFEARDSAGNTALQSFSVTVQRVAPGSVSFIVNSSTDGTLAFRSSTPALNRAVNVTGGVGRSGDIDLRPGNYAASYVPPSGFAVSNAECNSPDGKVNTADRSIALSLASGQHITCTLTMIDSVSQTERQIQSFIENRARQIMAHQPSVDRRIARVRGQTQAQQVTMLGYALPGTTGPVGVNVAQDRVNLTFSTSNALGSELSGPSAWDFWAEAAFSRYETNLAEGRFAVLHLGADYRISPRGLLGIAAQIDHNSETLTGTAAETEGTGWMVGPYYTGQLSENLFLDVSAKWGRASNTVSPLGTFSDDFNSSRWFASAALFGDLQRDDLAIRPTLRLNYFRETTDAFVNGLGATIGGQETRLGDLTMGAAFVWNTTGANGWASSPFVKVDGIWTYEASGGTGRLSNLNEGLRGRAEMGVTLTRDDNESLDFSISYDGIGDGDYSSLSAQFGVTMSF